MIRAHRPLMMFAASTLIAALSACASAKLQLDLALYEEDPGRSVLGASDVELMMKDLADLDAAAGKLSEHRSELARRASQLYDDCMVMITVAVAVAKGKETEGKEAEGKVARTAAEGARKDLENQGPKRFLPDYESRLSKAREEVGSTIANARKLLDTIAKASAAYEKRLNELAEQEKCLSDRTREAERAELAQIRLELLNKGQRIAAAIRAVASKLDELRGPLESHYETWSRDSWPLIPRLVEQTTLAKYLQGGPEPEEVKQLRNSLGAFAEEVEKCEQEGYRLGIIVSALLETLESETALTAGNLKQSVDAIAREATRVPASLAIGDRGQTALNDLLQSTSLLYSQIDRLQDPADPVWRIVSDPANEAKWNTEFVKTYFYAEGNTEVVIVRDSPMAYRVQQAQNNPKALVQAQLRVSRAVGDAALAVASASTGVDLSPMAGVDKKDGAPDDSNAAKGEELARKRAELEEKSRLRNGIMFVLSQDLVDQYERIEELDLTTPAGRERLSDLHGKVVQSLSSSKHLFEGGKPSGK